METAIQRLNRDRGDPEVERLFHAMAKEEPGLLLELKKIAHDRRSKYAEMFSGGELSRGEAYLLIKQREDDFLDEYWGGVIPEDLMRIEAQDVLLHAIHQKFEEEGLLERDD